MSNQTFYDWFIMLVAIPGMIFGFTAVAALWCFVIYTIFFDP
jgi:uncharacterized membrane protein